MKSSFLRVLLVGFSFLIGFRSYAQAPVITITPLTNTTSLAARSINASISSSPSPSPVSGQFVPRIYFRRLLPTLSVWSSGEGALLSGTGTSGNWQFSINYAAAGIIPGPNDVFQYYFAAQNETGQVSLLPATGGSHSDVLTQVMAPTSPYSFRIMELVPSNITVGTGQRFTSMTGSGGLFDYLNINEWNSDVSVSITSNLSEAGIYSLNTLYRNGFALHVAPSDNSVKIINNSGDLATPMIRVMRMDHLTIDGTIGGSGSFLRFINTHSAPTSGRSTILIDSSSTFITIKNCTVESNSIVGPPTEQACISIGLRGINNHINIIQNHIGNATGMPGIVGLVGSAILSSGNTRNLLIEGNEIYNFQYRGLSFTSIGDSCNIQNNHFYYNFNLSPEGNQTAILIESGGAHRIAGNFIGGSAPFCGGTPWLNAAPLALSMDWIGLKISTRGNVLDDVVTGNTVQNIHLSSTEDVNFAGLMIEASAIVTENIIGHPTQANSIQNDGSVFSAFSRGLDLFSLVQDTIIGRYNLVANITGTVNNSGAHIQGINIHGAAYVQLDHNVVHSLSAITGTSNSVTVSGIAGISSTVGGTPIIEYNEIHGLRAKVGSLIDVTGIDASNGGGITGRINNNRIYDLGVSGTNGKIYGLNLVGSWRVVNNQVAITNSGQTEACEIRGINENSFPGTYSSEYYYNSVYVGGTTNVGSLGSYAYWGTVRVSNFFNNLLFNDRSGGAGVHYAIWRATLTPFGWTATTANYNFFLTRNLSVVARAGIQNVDFANWRVATGGDKNSYIASSSAVPAGDFFMNTAIGDLSIDTTNSLSWYVHGKGYPVPGILSDYNDSDLRLNGSGIVATDIGSDEFTTSTLPVPLDIVGPHLPGTIDTLSQNGRIIATIQWANTGTLPTLDASYYYPGQWPNDTTNNGEVNNARFFSAWWHIQASGGSNYQYTLTLFYDPSILGRITNLDSMVISKKQSGVAGTWVTLTPTAIDKVNQTVRIANQTSFSEFTVSDKQTPLIILPLDLLSFEVVPTDASFIIRWQTDNEENVNYFEVERSADGRAFQLSHRISARNRGFAENYEYVDAPTFSGSQRFIYYRLKILNHSGAVEYSKILKLPLQDKWEPVIVIGPNPFRGKVQLAFNLDQNSDCLLTLVGADGRQVHQQNIFRLKGYSSFSINDLESLSAGAYILVVKIGGRMFQFKLAK